MSLQTIAKHMAAHGRGPDTELIHMSKGEIAGLQALAKAHGGSLTINPHTGLAEAGFLNRLLPTLVGAGLMYATGGASAGLTPELIGLGVGGLRAAQTGNLSEGLKAGLGAYGGAGIAGGLGAGAEAATPGAEAAVPSAPAPTSVDYTLQAPAGTGETLTAGTGAPTLTAPPNATSMFGSPSGMSDAARIDAAANSGSYADRISAAGAPPQGSSGIGSLSTKDAFKYGAASLGSMYEPKKLEQPEEYSGPLGQYKFDPEKYRGTQIQQPSPYYQAQMYNYADGGTVEQMSNLNSVGANTGYPMSDISHAEYATPWQTPVSSNMVTGSADTGVNQLTGEMNFAGGGGISSLGSYSDGGRMLKGPGDGMSDSIPAQIGAKQPARLADGEFVVPADVVSHLGNGSTDAGARQLYSMMDRIRQQRTGKKKQAPKVNPSKAMPA